MLSLRLMLVALVDFGEYYCCFGGVAALHTLPKYNLEENGSNYCAEVECCLIHGILFFSLPCVNVTIGVNQKSMCN